MQLSSKAFEAMLICKTVFCCSLDPNDAGRWKLVFWVPLASSLTSPLSPLPLPTSPLDKLRKMQKGGETNPGQIVFLSSGTAARTKTGSATFFSQLIQFLLPLLAPRKLYCAFNWIYVLMATWRDCQIFVTQEAGLPNGRPQKGGFRSPQQPGVWLSGFQAFNWLFVVPQRAFLNGSAQSFKEVCL